MADLKMPARRDPGIASGVKLKSVSLTPSLAMARFVFRGGTDAQAVCSRCLGLDLPGVALQSTHKDDSVVLWQGPDEWLIMLPEALRAERLRALETALVHLPHSLVDVSQRNVGFVLTGRDVETLLNTACPLDLCQVAFPVGMTSRTIFAKADITLWRQAADSFHVEVWRSFAPYVIGVLQEGARGL